MNVRLAANSSNAVESTGAAASLFAAKLGALSAAVALGLGEMEPSKPRPKLCSKTLLGMKETNMNGRNISTIKSVEAKALESAAQLIEF